MKTHKHGCPKCDGLVWIGVEYDHTNKFRYDGVSEWVCGVCGYREGRWCGQELTGNEVEARYCEGNKPHPISVDLDDN